jgi:Arc/MetJ-type ribon-helix-helix transcriptional regulator
MIIHQESDNMKNLNLRITIRLEQNQRIQINKALSEGQGKSVSDLIRTALTEFLKNT